MHFLDYPKNVHPLIAAHLCQTLSTDQPHGPVSWLSALQLTNPLLTGWLDPELSPPDLAAICYLLDTHCPACHGPLSEFGNCARCRPRYH